MLPNRGCRRWAHNELAWVCFLCLLRKKLVIEGLTKSTFSCMVFLPVPPVFLVFHWKMRGGEGSEVCGVVKGKGSFMSAAQSPGPLPEGLPVESAAEVPSDPWIGFDVRGFVIEKLLGQGGMGRVYLARLRSLLKQRSAIKILLADHALNEDVRERFVREAGFIATITDPHVISMQDFGAIKGPDGRTVLFLRMEYLEGRSLAAHLEEYPRLPIEEIAEIMGQVLEGIGAAHASNLIHRDLKPDNIYLARTSAGRLLVKVLDFGLGKSLSQSIMSHRLTVMDAVMGTVHYMSPEQARGEDVDARSDIYALGVMLYEMAVGKMPFDADSQHVLLARISSEVNRAPSPSAVHVNVSPLLEQVIAKAMYQSRHRRYQTVQQLATDFHLAITGRAPAIATREDVLAVFSHVPPLVEESTVSQRNVSTMDESVSLIISGPPLRKWPFLAVGLFLSLCLGGAIIYRSTRAQPVSQPSAVLVRPPVTPVPVTVTPVVVDAAPVATTPVLPPVVDAGVAVVADPPLVVAPVVEGSDAGRAHAASGRRHRPRGPRCGYRDPRTRLIVPCL